MNYQIMACWSFSQNAWCAYRRVSKNNLIPFEFLGCWPTKELALSLGHKH